jgi:flavodoxin I
MKTLVVYDSFFGNTEKVAQAIGAAAGAEGEVAVLRVGEVRDRHLAGLDLLLVGSPTRAFRPSPAIKDWLKSLPPHGLDGVAIAAFDTRLDVAQVNSRLLTLLARLFGYAARPMADGLVRKGGRQAVPPEGFIVEGSEGPLTDGELERATAWAQQVLEAARGTASR